MNLSAIVINIDKRNCKLLAELAEKLGGQVFHLKADQIEDLAMGSLMNSAKTGETMSKRSVMKNIRSHNGSSTYHAQVEKSTDGWYVGQIIELQEVVSQGKSLEELRANLADALQLVLKRKRPGLSRSINA